MLKSLKLRFENSSKDEDKAGQFLFKKYPWDEFYGRCRWWNIYGKAHKQPLEWKNKNITQFKPKWNPETSKKQTNNTPQPAIEKTTS